MMKSEATKKPVVLTTLQRPRAPSPKPTAGLTIAEMANLNKTQETAPPTLPKDQKVLLEKKPKNTLQDVEPKESECAL